jgi:hypothetical protein
MIPYDDLVIALQTWRAKQGLPVGQLSGQLTPPPQQAGKQPSGPTFSNAGPPPLQRASEESMDVDGALIEEAQEVQEEHYEAESNDFAMAFGQEAAPGQDESTSIGEMPHDGSGTEVASPAGGRSRGRGGQQDW